MGCSRRAEAGSRSRENAEAESEVGGEKFDRSSGS